MRQIAQRAGIVPGGIYNHFASKENLFRALLEARSPYPQFIAAIESLEGESGPQPMALPDSSGPIRREENGQV